MCGGLGKVALQPRYIWLALNDDIGDVLSDTDMNTIRKNGVCDVMPTVSIPFMHMALFLLKSLIASFPIWPDSVLLAQHYIHKDTLSCMHVQGAIYVDIVSNLLLS